MKLVRLLLALMVAFWWTSDAGAQYGLHGSPEMIRLPPTEAIQLPAYPSTSPGAAAWPSVPPSTPVTPRASYPAYLAQAPGPVPTPASPMQGVPLSSPPQAMPMPGPNVVNQMLCEPGYSAAAQNWSGYGSANGSVGYNGYGNGPCGQPGQQPCPDLGNSCAPCYQPCWYFAAAGLVMSRDHGNRVWTSYQTDNNAQQDMHTQDARIDWQGGFEVRAGRTFCCGQWAMEGTYWQLGDFHGFASRIREFPDSLSTPLAFNDVVYENPAIPGTPVQLFDFAREHRIWRTNEFQNLELNLIHHQLAMECANTFNIDWSVGVRYFRFDERLVFGSLQQNVPPTLPYTWGGNGGRNEGYLDDDIHNNLVGFQLGFKADYPLFDQNLRLYITPKFGIYNNHIEHRFAAYRGDGEKFAPAAASGVPGSFPVSSNADVISFLTQIDLGLDWQFAANWDAFFGYRVLVATGIGLADNQFHPYVVDVPAYAHIETNGELILHGAFAGVGCRF